MKRSLNSTKEENKNSSLVTLDGYVVNVGIITKNNNNENHHYSFLLSLMDQSTVRITKFLSKIASCALHKRLQESMLGGCGASITALREQNDQYLCTFATKLIDKELTFRPICVRVQSIENLKNNIFEGLCTIEVKICEIGNDILCTFEESDFKKVQKFKRIAIVGDATGALEITLWESQFNKIELGNCYQIKLVKSRLINFELSFSANADTSFIKIDDLGIVETNVDSTIKNLRSCYGRIVNLSKNQLEYACQACGKPDVIEETYCIVCNICQCRIPKYNIEKDQLFKITITTDNRHEYNLFVSEIILIPVLTCINESYTNINHLINEEHFINALGNVIVEFKFDQNTGIISELKIFKKVDSLDKETVDNDSKK